MGSNTHSTRIEEKLAMLTGIGKGRCIYKVHELLRDVNEKAYKPTLLAIGPYHHGKVGHGFIEERKLRYLQQMLIRTNGSVETYITALRELDERALKCYGDQISQTSDEFVEMMLLDGCFIIELFRKYEIYHEKGDCQDDPIFQMKWVLPSIARDLLLFENQLPFFILVQLFGMSERNNTLLHNRSRNLGGHVGDIEDGEDGISVESSTSTNETIQTQRLIDLALKFFSRYLPFKWNIDGSSYNSTEMIKHLLYLAHEALTPSLPDMEHRRLKFGHKFEKAEFEHLLGLIHATISISIPDTKLDQARERHEARVKLKNAEIFKCLFGPICEALTPLIAKMENMTKVISDTTQYHSATELKEAGIKFKKAEKLNLFSIEFNNGLLEISPLSIGDHTETYLRNLIAYEQYCDQQNGSDYVYNYVRFMDRLINTPKDVELLRRKGIISNRLGGDEIVSAMVNKLGHNVTFSTNNYDSYAMDAVNMHCRRRWNVWMAKLRHDYFSSPWALLSFLVAVVLIALAITQTIFSIIH